MLRSLSVSLLSLLALAACGGSAVEDADVSEALTVAATLGPQSFVHGTLTARTPQLAYAFHASEGDVIAPDAWVTPGSAPFVPTLILRNGRRDVVAAGRDGAEAHPALDGFRVPKTGTYVLVVGHRGSAVGTFTLRLWMQSSHLPRVETAQLDLSPRPSAGFARNFGEDDFEALLAELQAQHGITALTDAALLLQILHAPDHVARAREAVAALIGTPEAFALRTAEEQAFALRWLDGTLFTSAPGSAGAVDRTVRSLISSWPHAHEREVTVQRVSFGGLTYGFTASTIATQDDKDGTPVWIDFSTEWFGPTAIWLGEQSQGASEPDD